MSDIVYLSPKGAAFALGIGPRGLRNRAAAGTVPRESRGGGRGYNYGVDRAAAVAAGVWDEERECETIPTDAGWQPPAPPLGSDDLDTDAGSGDTSWWSGHPDIVENYYTRQGLFYDGKVYVFNLKSRQTPLVWGRDRVEEFVEAYSHLGGNKTLNQMKAAFGIGRKTVHELKTLLGITHDSLPYTDAQILESGDQDLIDDLVARKSGRVESQAQQVYWAKQKKRAAQFDSFDKFVGHRLEEIMEKWTPPEGDLGPPPPCNEDGQVVVMTPTDAHFSKFGSAIETGELTNTEIAVKRFEQVTRKCLHMLQERCKVREFLLGIGSDMFHIDTMGKTTTRGTPQDVDGTWATQYIAGVDAYVWYVQTLLEVAPVTMFNLPGNHDYISSIALWKHMVEFSQHREGCEVVGDLQTRQYLKRGNNLLAFQHGDKTTDHKFAQLIAAEAPVLYGQTKNHMGFRGHHHTLRVERFVTAEIIHMPSISGTDKWHADNGYRARKELGAFVIDDEDGLVDVVRAVC